MIQADKDYIDSRMETIESRMDGRLAAFQAAMDGRFAALEGKMREMVAEVIKWMIGIFIATLTIFISVMTFELNAIPKAGGASGQTSAPVIIQLPPYPAAPASLPPRDKEEAPTGR